MTTIRTILLDDEPASLNTLKLLVERFCPTLTVAHACTDPREAIEAMLDQKPDLLLLDIEMPELSGFDVLAKTRPIVEPAVIFATAHNEYAIRAFKFSSVDYLMKPVEAAALVPAVARAAERIWEKRRSLELEVLLKNHRHRHTAPSDLALPTKDGLTIVRLEDIAYLEAIRTFTVFHFHDQTTEIVTRHLGYFEDMLEVHDFFRIHDKHIVNRRYLQSYVRGEGGEVKIKGFPKTSLDVSRRRKEPFLKWLRHEDK